MSAPPGERTGPVEAGDWPEQLTARVVTTDPSPRIHGYDVETDLACHYHFGETMLLMLTGELPEPARGRAFEAALTYAAPLSVREAPAHGALLARICHAPPSGVLGFAAAALAERHRATLEDLRPLLHWLETPTGSPPNAAQATSDADRACCHNLRTLLDEFGFPCPALVQGLSRDAACIAVLFACGLRRVEQLATALLLARLPAIAAESFAANAGDFAGYPMRLPRFDYDGRDDV